MSEKTTDLIRRYIQNAETAQALETLLGFVNRTFGGEEQDEVLLLHAKFNDYQLRVRRNLVEDDIEKNQINLTVLKICRVLEAKMPEESDSAVIPEPDASAEKINERLGLLEGQLRMMHRMLERLADDDMDRFQRSRIWNNLNPGTKDHMLAAIALDRDDYLGDYATVVLEFCEALECELREKVFLPFREAFKEDGRVPERELFFDHSVSQVKNHLFDFLTKEKDLTLSQMIRVLYENLNDRSDSNIKSKHFLKILDFLFDNFKFKNLESLLKTLRIMSESRFDRTARAFIFSMEEANDFKKMVIDILSGIQPKH